ncbi:MAG: hypothetical protein ACKVVP_21505 [Chloroflexota bacterium]
MSTSISSPSAQAHISFSLTGNPVKSPAQEHRAIQIEHTYCGLALYNLFHA